MIHPLTDHVTLSIWSWTFWLLGAFVAGMLNYRLAMRARKPNRRDLNRTGHWKPSTELVEQCRRDE